MEMVGELMRHYSVKGRKEKGIYALPIVVFLYFDFVINGEVEQ